MYLTLTDIAAAFRGLLPFEISAFEKEFAHFIGVRHAVATSYGRTALYLGLKAIDVEEREVLLPDFTCAVVRQAVANAGAVPRFVKVDSTSLTFNREDLLSKINSSTAAILVTHYFGGIASDLRELRELCSDRGLYLIEDCAHSLGAVKLGVKAGATGDFSIFSLTKSTVNFGGGVLVTDKGELNAAFREVLLKERKDLKRRIFDFPAIVAYGLSQAIEKLDFDRIGPDHTWLMRIPDFILRIRAALISPFSFWKKKVRPDIEDAGPSDSEIPPEPQLGVRRSYDHDIRIAGFIAAVGRNQLRRLGRMTSRRERIWEMVRDASFCHKALRSQADDVSSACSFLAFDIAGTDPETAIAGAREQGLFLRPTWPLRQRPWNGQDSESYRELGRKILVWNMSPDVTDGEVQRLCEIVTDLIPHTGPESTRAPDGNEITTAGPTEWRL